ncbi:MAG TPA: OmpA family protein [Myxococcota bacterium]|nr:OmpA family protein [Myxococcota bacterium]
MPTLANLAAATGLLALSALGCVTAGSAPVSAPPGPAVPTVPVVSSLSVRPGPIGDYLDRQTGDLETLAHVSGVDRRPDALVVSLASASLFDQNAAALSDAGAQRVRAIAGVIQRYPKQRVIVKGHTDSEGSERASQRLSEDRADSVRNLLIAEGVAPSRITAIGMGASLPVASNSTAEGREQNQRIELELRPDDDVLQGASSQ